MSPPGGPPGAGGVFFKYTIVKKGLWKRDKKLGKTKKRALFFFFMFFSFRNGCFPNFNLQSENTPLIERKTQIRMLNLTDLCVGIFSDAYNDYMH